MLKLKLIVRENVERTVRYEHCDIEQDGYAIITLETLDDALDFIDGLEYEFETVHETILTPVFRR